MMKNRISFFRQFCWLLFILLLLLSVGSGTAAPVLARQTNQMPLTAIEQLSLAAGQSPRGNRSKSFSANNLAPWPKR
jgi:hypothetical protein